MSAERDTSRLLSNKTRSSRYRLDPDAAEPEERKAPWRKLALAAILLIIGAVFLAVGLDQFFLGKDGGIPMIVIGSFAFLPGFYHVYIAYAVWKGYRGYSLDQIPDM